MGAVGLTNKEFGELLVKYRNGDEASGTALIRGGLILVENIASHRATKCNYDYALIFWIGKNGLNDAIKNFNGENNEFRSFAISFISNKIDNFLRANPVPTIPVYSTDIIQNIISSFNLNADKRDYLEIRYMIEILPPKVKKCIVLVYGEHKSIEEVSSLLSVDVSSVNNAFNVVKEKLAAKFGLAIKEKATELISKAEAEKSSKEIITSKLPSVNPKPKKEEAAKEIIIPIKVNFQDNFKGQPIEDLEEAVSILPKKQKDLIYRMFGKKLDEYHELSENEKQEFKNIVLKNIYKLLAGVQIRNNNGYKSKLITELFPDKELEEIKVAVSKLPDYEQAVVYEIYGTNLSTYNSEANENNKHKFYQTIRKHISLLFDGKRLPKKGNNGKYRELITELFPEKEPEEIKAAVSKLPDYEQSIVYEIYGTNLSTYNSEASLNNKHKFYQTIKEHISLLLAGKDLPKAGIKGKSITELFPEKELEEIKVAVSKLPNDEQSIVYEIYGEDLNTYNSEASLNNKHRFHQTIKGHINLLLAGKKLPKGGVKSKPITELFPDKELEEIKVAVSKLPNDEQSIVYEIYGKDLNTYNSEASENNKPRFYQTIKGHISLLLDDKELPKKRNNGKYKKLITELFPNKEPEEIKAAVSKLPDYEQAVVYEIYGLNLDMYNGKTDQYNKSRFYHTIKGHISLLLAGKELPKKGGHKVSAKLITEWFPGTSISELKMAIDKLPANYRNIVYNIYGENLDTYNSTPYMSIFHQVIRRKISINLKSARSQALYETISFPKSNDSVLLQESTLAALKKKYKVSVDAPVAIPISPEYSYQIVVPKEAMEKKASQFNFDGIANLILSIISKHQELTKEEIEIFAFRVSLVEQNDASIENICKQFNVTEEQINAISFKVLNTIKDDFDSIYTIIMKDLYPKDSKGLPYQIQHISDKNS